MNIKTESEKVEFKASFGEWKEIVETLCAFANKKGGRVIVGLDDRGRPAALRLGKGSLEDFANKVRVITIMTGVQSPYILGRSTLRKEEKSSYSEMSDLGIQVFR